jgi:hypothetical protein
MLNFLARSRTLCRSTPQALAISSRIALFIFKPCCAKKTLAATSGLPQVFDRAVFIAQGNRRSGVSQPDLNAKNVTAQVPHHLNGFSSIRVYSSFFRPALRSAPLPLVAFPALVAAVECAIADGGIPAISSISSGVLLRINIDAR